MRNANLSYAIALNTNIRDGAKLGGAITSTFVENESDLAKLQNDELATTELMNMSNNVPSDVLFTIMHNLSKLEEKLRSVGSTINQRISTAYGSFKSFLGFGSYGQQGLEAGDDVYNNRGIAGMGYGGSLSNDVYNLPSSIDNKYGISNHKKDAYHN